MNNPGYEESLTLRRELGDQRGLAEALANLGTTRHVQGDAAGARALFEESLRLLRALGEQADIAECLEGLAGVACAQGDCDRAARLFGAAAKVRAAIGVPRLPADRAVYDQYVAAARAGLGEAGFAAAWAAGRALSLEEAIARALSSF